MQSMDIASFVQKFLQVRILRVAIIGGLGVIAQTALFEILGVYLSVVAPSTAAIVGGEAGLLISFVLNHQFAFNDRVGHWPTQLLRYHGIVAGSLIIQWLCVFAAEHLSTNLLVLHGAYAAGIVIGFCSNYIGYHLFVWKHVGEPTP